MAGARGVAAGMEKRIVLEVLGEPEDWLNAYSPHWDKKSDLRGAPITAVFAAGSDFRIQTRGSPSGETVALFSIKDADVDRLMKVLKVGMDVHDAVWLKFER